VLGVNKLLFSDQTSVELLGSSLAILGDLNGSTSSLSSTLGLNQSSLLSSTLLLGQELSSAKDDSVRVQLDHSSQVLQWVLLLSWALDVSWLSSTDLREGK